MKTDKRAEEIIVRNLRKYIGIIDDNKYKQHRLGWRISSNEPPLGK